MSLRKLQNIHEQVLKCTKCPLHKTRTNAVPGYGNLTSPLIFIGEAPGKNEDLKGLPFVGAAGKFLDEMLENINLKRDDIFITNIVKCRPPNNRDPETSEIDTCLPYLKEQIILMNPKIVVTLGRFAMNLFLPQTKISQIHGQPQKINNLLILPLYHPAAALYNGSNRSVLKKDFQILRSIVDKIPKK